MFLLGNFTEFIRNYTILVCHIGLCALSDIGLYLSDNRKRCNTRKDRINDINLKKNNNK